MKVSVFCGASVDGFIARANGALDFLDAGGSDPHGYEEFMATVDTIVMGRATFEVVLSFDAWPFTKPVVVLSSRPVDLSAARARGAQVEQMAGLQLQLVRLMRDVIHGGKRMVVLFEGRDAAGKGGTIERVRENLNPRSAYIVALPKPSERETGEAMARALLRGHDIAIEQYDRDFIIGRSWVAIYDSLKSRYPQLTWNREEMVARTAMMRDEVFAELGVTVLPGARDVFYWSKEDFGFKPMVSIVHGIVYQPQSKSDRAYVVQKQLYASHYYSGSLAIATLVSQVENGAPWTYLVYVNRSRGDVKGGFGGLRRNLAEGQARKAAEETLTTIKEQVEQTAEAPAAQPHPVN